MDGSIWPALALFVLAVVLRARKRRDRIDWKSRGILLLLATVICVMFHHWLAATRLIAAEEAAASGMPRPHGLVELIAEHYQVVLLPVLILIVTVVIDLLSRLIARRTPVTVEADRGRMLWRTLAANLLLFVATPGLLYNWTTQFAASDSIMASTAREVVMPIVATYGAPAYWLIDATRANGRTLREPPWPWNPMYRDTSVVSLHDFLHDASAWAAFAIALTIRVFRRGGADKRQIIDYFATPATTPAPTFLHRMAFGPWRGRAALIFTTVWLGSAMVWCGFTRFVLSLGYWIFGAIALGTFAGLLWLINATLRRARAGD